MTVQYPLRMSTQAYYADFGSNQVRRALDRASSFTFPTHRQQRPPFAPTPPLDQRIVNIDSETTLLLPGNRRTDGATKLTTKRRRARAELAAEDAPSGRGRYCLRGDLEDQDNSLEN